ncbi:RNA polymerase sigma factor [Oscillospiraceae bacterium 50-58]
MTQWNSAQQAGRFVEAYADAIFRLCLTYSLTREDAQDICQDIFLTLLEDDRQFEDGEHEKAFVLRCAVNACKDLLKSAGRRRTVSMDQAELLPAPEREDSGLPEAIRALPRHYGAALYLFYYEGYSLDEIARLCGCTPAAARKRLSRARKLLAKRLEVIL